MQREANESDEARERQRQITRARKEDEKRGKRGGSSNSNRFGKEDKLKPMSARRQIDDAIAWEQVRKCVTREKVVRIPGLEAAPEVVRAALGWWLQGRVEARQAADMPPEDSPKTV